MCLLATAKTFVLMCAMDYAQSVLSFILYDQLLAGRKRENATALQLSRAPSKLRYQRRRAGNSYLNATPRLSSLNHLDRPSRHRLTTTGIESPSQLRNHLQFHVHVARGIEPQSRRLSGEVTRQTVKTTDVGSSFQRGETRSPRLPCSHLPFCDPAPSPWNLTSKRFISRLSWLSFSPPEHFSQVAEMSISILSVATTGTPHASQVEGALQPTSPLDGI